MNHIHRTLEYVNFRNVTVVGSNIGRYATGSYNTFLGSYVVMETHHNPIVQVKIMLYWTRNA